MNNPSKQPGNSVPQPPEAPTRLPGHEAYLESIFRAAPTGIGVLVNRVILKVNQRLCEMTGYSREELEGCNARMLYTTQEEYEYVGREKYAQINQYGTGTVETRWRHKAGRLIDILLSSTPIVLGDSSKGVTFTALDITGRKQAEKALEESRRMLQLVLDTIPVRVFWKDIDLNFLGCNRRFAQDAGLSTPAEIVGRNDYQMGWSDQAPMYRKDDLAVITSGAPKFNYEEPQTTPRGERIWLRTSKIPLRDDTGDIIGVLGTYEEITALKQAEEQIRQLQKAESMGRMAGAVAHHFNGMLGEARNHLETALKSHLPDTSVREKLALALEAVHRATDLSSQIMVYPGQTATKNEPLDLAGVCRNTLASVNAALLESIKTELPGRGPVVLADGAQLNQVLSNLLQNAQEAVVYGRGNINISVSEIPAEAIPAEQCHPPGWHAEAPAYACLTVSDTGCGMQPDELDRAFDPFFSTKRDSRGLGLPVVLGIVKAHNGALRLESQPDRGTTCQIFLPILTRTPPEPA